MWDFRVLAEECIMELEWLAFVCVGRGSFTSLRELLDTKSENEDHQVLHTRKPEMVSVRLSGCWMMSYCISELWVWFFRKEIDVPSKDRWNEQRSHSECLNTQKFEYHLQKNNTYIVILQPLLMLHFLYFSIKNNNKWKNILRKYVEIVTSIVTVVCLDVETEQNFIQRRH